MGTQIVKHNVDFDGIALEGLIDLPTLDEVTQIRQTVKVLGSKRRSRTPLRYANATE